MDQAGNISRSENLPRRLPYTFAFSVSMASLTTAPLALMSLNHVSSAFSRDTYFGCLARTEVSSSTGTSSHLPKSFSTVETVDLLSSNESSLLAQSASS